jgi:hypothetical protein
MQELMSRHKTTTFSPRDCLKTILHQRWSKTCSGNSIEAVQINNIFQFLDTRPPPKPRRKRKAAAGNNNLPPTKDSNINNCTTPTKKRTPANNIYPAQGINNLPGVRKSLFFTKNL